MKEAKKELRRSKEQLTELLNNRRPKTMLLQQGILTRYLVRGFTTQVLSLIFSTPLENIVQQQNGVPTMLHMSFQLLENAEGIASQGNY